MLTIILLMLAFALIHSLTADQRVKRWFMQQAGERFYYGWYRICYNIVSVLTLVPVFLTMRSSTQVLWQFEGFPAHVFIALQIIGILGVLLSLLQIDFLRFAGLRQVMVYLSGGELPLRDEPLKTDGLYGFVRHPLYFFSLIVLWFSPTMTTGGLAFNTAATLYFVFGSRVEEARMLTAYGEHYASYRQRVPWLIPLKSIQRNAVDRVRNG